MFRVLCGFSEYIGIASKCWVPERYSLDQDSNLDYLVSFSLTGIHAMIVFVQRPKWGVTYILLLCVVRVNIQHQFVSGNTK